MAMIAMQFDARVIGFALVLGAILSLVGGLWPAWRAVRRSLAVTTRFSSGMTDAVSSRVSRVLLSSELAVATIVMIGTLFIGLGIWRYLNQPLGFDTGDRFTVSLAHHPGLQAGDAGRGPDRLRGDTQRAGRQSRRTAQSAAQPWCDS